jgi:uncharacterized protein (DUF1778 family)
MRKTKSSKPAKARISDGISTRVRFASHQQIKLVERAAKHRGMSRDAFIQQVLQASAEKVLTVPSPPDPVIAQASKAAVDQL